MNGSTVGFLASTLTTSTAVRLQSVITSESGARPVAPAGGARGSAAASVNADRPTRRVRGMGMRLLGVGGSGGVGQLRGSVPARSWSRSGASRSPWSWSRGATSGAVKASWVGERHSSTSAQVTGAETQGSGRARRV